MSYKVELPDIEEMFKLIDRITELAYEKSILDLDIKFIESEITRTVTNDPTYFIGGKTPSMAYIESTWKFTGFDGKLMPKRKELAQLSSELDNTKLKFQLFRDLIDLYRTQSANERSQMV